jgi:ferredoxin
VAGAISDQLSGSGQAVTLVDLADAAGSRTLIEGVTNARNPFLFVGSPVYNDMAVPPVMEVIDALPRLDNAWAVPFVTYGRACSGVALWQMAAALDGRGFRIAGAAKIVAVHSLMWQSDHPEGEGRPNADDLRQARRLADGVLSRLDAGTLKPLPLESLDYQPAEMAAGFKAKLTQPWRNIPRVVDKNACNECAECMDGCPAGAISLNPLPEFGDGCFDCFNCIRLCPEQAIAPAIPMEKIENLIRDRVRTIDERPLSEIFPDCPGD